MALGGGNIREGWDRKSGSIGWMGFAGVVFLNNRVSRCHKFQRKLARTTKFYANWTKAHSERSSKGSTPRPISKWPSNLNQKTHNIPSCSTSANSTTTSTTTPQSSTRASPTSTTAQPKVTFIKRRSIQCPSHGSHGVQPRKLVRKHPQEVFIEDRAHAHRSNDLQNRVYSQ